MAANCVLSWNAPHILARQNGRAVVITRQALRLSELWQARCDAAQSRPFTIW